MKLRGQKGFSLVELMIVVSLVAILSAIAIPALLKYQRDYKYLDYASQMEYMVKIAKIHAMERTTNVGVCVSGNALTIRDIGTSRGAGICTGTELRRMSVTDSYVTLAGSGGSFDPRGLAIFLGNVCVAYDGKHRKVCISRTGVRTDIERTGGCVSCTQ